ncbi:MAG: SMC-Scp complex subunit ScpB [Minisyncoccia bacterium]
MNTLQQKIESLLFFKNEPVSFAWLGKHLDITAGEVKESVHAMLSYYENRGLTLVISDDSVSLLSSDVAADIIGGLGKNNAEKELSKQALETLAIILYKGAIGKPELDYIRGVNSVFILRNLLIRGLIEKKPNPADKRSPLYAATHDTMSFLGIHSKSELPDFENFSKKIAELEQNYIAEEKELNE